MRNANGLKIYRQDLSLNLHLLVACKCMNYTRSWSLTVTHCHVSKDSHLFCSKQSDKGYGLEVSQFKR